MWKQKLTALPEPTPPAPPPVLRLGRIDDERVEHLRSAIRIAHGIIGQAIREQSDQIRLTPQGERTTVEYQIGGCWNETMRVPHQELPGLFSAFKALAGLPDWEYRMALQGLIAVRHEGTGYDVLIFVTPSRQGETILMRIEALNALLEQTPE